MMRVSTSSGRCLRLVPVLLLLLGLLVCLFATSASSLA